MASRHFGSKPPTRQQRLANAQKPSAGEVTMTTKGFGDEPKKTLITKSEGMGG